MYYPPSLHPSVTGSVCTPLEQTQAERKCNESVNQAPFYFQNLSLAGADRSQHDTQTRTNRRIFEDCSNKRKRNERDNMKKTLAQNSCFSSFILYFNLSFYFSWRAWTDHNTTSTSSKRRSGTCKQDRQTPRHRRPLAILHLLHQLRRELLDKWIEIRI